MSEGFGLDHLPFGSVVTRDGRRIAVVRYLDRLLDLSTIDGAMFASGSLDTFLGAGRDIWTSVREAAADRIAADREAFVPLAEVTPVLAFAVADYVDFYASEHHATNVGRIFRPDGEPLTPNWKHLPIGYHGRAGTVVASSTPVRRPKGQYRAADGSITFGPSRRLDVEAEVGFVVGRGSAPGEPVGVGQFREHVFGVCLLNDWSARDIQFWESAPLGPFLGKSFATSVSPWITPLDALADAWIAPPRRDPAVLPYLDDSAGPGGLDLELELSINDTVVSRPPFATTYWTPAQMLAHMTVNGATLRTGDLFASGTVSGPEADQRGCLLELTWNGTEPVALADGSSRTFLEDGDVVRISATAPGRDGRIRLGDVVGTVVAADQLAAVRT